MSDAAEHDTDAHELAMDLCAAAIAWRQTFIRTDADGRRKTYGNPSGAYEAERVLLAAAERYADILPNAS